MTREWMLMLMGWMFRIVDGNEVEMDAMEELMWMPMEVGVDYAANSITMICLKFAKMYTITCI